MIYTKDINETRQIMITQENREFVNFLFDKLLIHTDTDMIDLQDDDTCCDHVLFSQLELF